MMNITQKKESTPGLLKSDLKGNIEVLWLKDKIAVAEGQKSF